MHQRVLVRNDHRGIAHVRFFKPQIVGKKHANIRQSSPRVVNFDFAQMPRLIVMRCFADAQFQSHRFVSQ